MWFLFFFFFKNGKFKVIPMRVYCIFNFGIIRKCLIHIFVIYSARILLIYLCLSLCFVVNDRLYLVIYDYIWLSLSVYDYLYMTKWLSLSNHDYLSSAVCLLLFGQSLSVYDYLSMTMWLSLSSLWLSINYYVSVTIC